jgi:hypothetical protein
MPLVKSPRLTPAKLAADRANARKGTGPRTAEGKRRVMLNALKHGRYARTEKLIQGGADAGLLDWIHAQLVASLLAQALGDGAHGELRARVNRLVWDSFVSGRRSDGDKMPASLPAEDRKCGGNAVQNALDVDVDHLLPILDAKVVEGRNRHDSGIADEHVQLSVPVACQFDEAVHLFAPCHVGACVGCFPTPIRDAGGQIGKAIRAARPPQRAEPQSLPQCRCLRQ